MKDDNNNHNDDERAQQPTAADCAEMLARLEAELASGELLVKVAKAATKWVRILRDAGIPVSTRTHEDLAHEAVLATIEMRRAWDGTYPLGAHLNAAVGSEARNLLQHQKKQRHLALHSELRMEDTSPGDCARVADLASRGAKPAERASRAFALHDAAARMLDAIRSYLPRDAAAQLVANAWELGETKREDGIETTGLTPAAYDAAVKRIKRMINRLPDEVRTGTEDAMEVSHGA